MALGNSINADSVGITTINASGVWSGSVVSQYYTVIGNTNNTITSVAPSATSGVPLISQGSSANPAYGTAVVAGGGTGLVTTTAYGVICGGTTATGNFQNAGAGTSGQLLQSGGASALPAYTTATYPGTAGTSGTLLISNGTNIVNTTSTYPTTNAAHTLLYASSANTMAALATADNGVLLTSASGVPSIGNATVAVGGTGNTTFTAYSVICAGTTATGSFQNVSGVGTTGQVLTSNGASALPTWQAAGSGGFTSITVQVFTSSGTYTPTSGMLYCTIECVGGGGGGGGCTTTTGFNVSIGGGGGGGGYARKTVAAATIGASQTVTIGAAGSAGASAGGTGGTGGTTSLGSICVATGGVGGTGAGNNNNSVAVGGAGGAGTTGDFLASGGPGVVGFGISVGLGFTGAGGNSIFGGGPVAAYVTGTYSVAGTNGTVYGGGGSGGGSGSTGTGTAGGTGAKGIVIVTEYI